MRAFGARWKATIRDRGEKSLREEKESVRKVLQGRGVYSIRAVSYTHLDVYKRQDL